MFHVKQYKLHEILFYIFLFLIPFQTRIIFNSNQAYIGSYFSYDLALYLYLSDIILIPCLVSWLIFDKPKIDRIFVYILAFISLILITLFHVKRVDLAWFHVFKWVELLGLVLYLKDHLKRLNLKLVLGVIVLAGILQAGLGLYQFHVQHDFNLGFTGEYISSMGTPGLSTIDIGNNKLIRAYGTFPHPNVLGGFLVFALISALILVSRETLKNKIFVSCATYILLLGLFVSFSRTAWLGAGIVMVGSMVYWLWKQERINLGFVILVLVVSCATIGLNYSDLVLNRSSNIVGSTSYIDRGLFNHLGLKIFNTYPVLGVGVGNYIPALNDMFHPTGWQNQPAHNIFIVIAVELGILGVMLFATIILKIFGTASNFKKEYLNYMLLVGGMVFVIMSMFDHYFVTIQQGQLTFFTLLGLIAGTSTDNDEKS